MDKILFATGNKDKATEAQKILGIPIEITDIEIDEIQSLDIYEVVEKKAKFAFSILKKPLFVEDVGVFINAWNGFPGPLIKFLHKAGNNSYDLMLKMLENETDKTAEIKAVIGFHDGEKVNIVEGSFRGKFVEKRGENGWGFDPFIIPEGYHKTFGELSEELKNKISHRARALNKFKEFLDSQKEQK